MFYTYVLKSTLDPNRIYIGYTHHLENRIQEHNSGSEKSLYTKKYAPWEIAVSIAFPSETQAITFEKYLKSGSGRSFLYKHFIIKTN